MNEFIQRLGVLDACAVSDAKDSLGLLPGVSGISRQSTGQTIAGRILTVRLESVAASGNATGPARHLCTASIEVGGPGWIIVVEQLTNIDAGAWGGVLSQAAYQQGIEGVIIEGLSRDIDEARQIGFPVFARGTTARTARGRVREVDNGGAITVGGQQVNQGDYVIADDSGIVFTDQADIAEVLQTAEAIANTESMMIQSILAGEPVSQVMGASYEQMLRKK